MYLLIHLRLFICEYTRCNAAVRIRVREEAAIYSTLQVEKVEYCKTMRLCIVLQSLTVSTYNARYSPPDCGAVVYVHVGVCISMQRYECMSTDK